MRVTTHYEVLFAGEHQRSLNNIQEALARYNGLLGTLLQSDQQQGSSGLLQKNQQLQNYSDQRKENCRICLKLFRLADLSVHSKYCQEQLKIEESIKKIDSEVLREYHKATGYKNKIKFEIMTHRNKPRRDLDQSGMAAERASVGGLKMSLRYLEASRSRGSSTNFNMKDELLNEPEPQSEKIIGRNKNNSDDKKPRMNGAFDSIKENDEEDSTPAKTGRVKRQSKFGSIRREEINQLVENIAKEEAIVQVKGLDLEDNDNNSDYSDKNTGLNRLESPRGDNIPTIGKKLLKRGTCTESEIEQCQIGDRPSYSHRVIGDTTNPPNKKNFGIVLREVVVQNQTNKIPSKKSNDSGDRIFTIKQNLSEVQLPQVAVHGPKTESSDRRSEDEGAKALEVSLEKRNRQNSEAGNAIKRHELGLNREISNRTANPGESVVSNANLTDRRGQDEGNSKDREARNLKQMNAMVEFLEGIECYGRDLAKDQYNLQFDIAIELKANHFRSVFNYDKADPSGTDQKGASMNFTELETFTEIDLDVLDFLKGVIPLHNLVTDAAQRRKGLIGKLRNIENILHQNESAANLGSQSPSKVNLQAAASSQKPKSIMSSSFRMFRKPININSSQKNSFGDRIEEDENENRPSVRASDSAQTGHFSFYTQSQSGFSEAVKAHLTIDTTFGESEVETAGPISILSRFRSKDQIGPGIEPEIITERTNSQKTPKSKVTPKGTVSNKTESKTPSNKDKIVEALEHILPHSNQEKSMNSTSATQPSVKPQVQILSMVNLKNRLAAADPSKNFSSTFQSISKLKEANISDMIYPRVTKPHKWAPGMEIKETHIPDKSFMYKWKLYLDHLRELQELAENEAEEEHDEDGGDEEDGYEEGENGEGEQEEQEEHLIEENGCSDNEEHIQEGAEEHEGDEKDPNHGDLEVEDGHEESSESENDQEFVPYTEYIQTVEEFEKQEENLEIGMEEFGEHPDDSEMVEQELQGPEFEDKEASDLEQANSDLAVAGNTHQINSAYQKRTLSPIPEAAIEKQSPERYSRGFLTEMSLNKKRLDLSSVVDARGIPAGKNWCASLPKVDLKDDRTPDGQQRHLARMKTLGGDRAAGLLGVPGVVFYKGNAAGRMTYNFDDDGLSSSSETYMKYNPTKDYLEDEEPKPHQIRHEYKRRQDSIEVSRPDYVRLVKSDSEVRLGKKEVFEDISPPVTLDDFEFVRKLGQGGFGKVFLVKRKSTGDPYAMKIIRFRKDLDEQFVQNVLNENEIFKIVEDKFVVTALFTFIHQNYICFVMEWMRGGDMKGLLEDNYLFEQDAVQFFAAELVLAINYLHSKNIVHRDLKPDNILIDSKGHLKLTDFGLSGIKDKVQVLEVNQVEEGEEAAFAEAFLRNNPNQKHLLDLENGEKRQSHRSPHSKSRMEGSKVSIDKDEKIHIVGTPDYIAPEVLKGESAEGFPSDWWALGVIIYEMLTGCPPFNAADMETVFQNILQLRIQWPPIGICLILTLGYVENCISPEAQDLILKLLNLKPSERLGSKGIEEIKDHPFFRGNVDWDDLYEQEPPEIVLDKLKEAEMTSEQTKPEAVEEAASGLDNTQGKIAGKFQNKLEGFDQVRFDLLHVQNVKVYENIM